MEQNKPLFLIKTKAFLTHLFLSAIVILSFVFVVWFIWYPYPLLNIEGGIRLIILLFCIDLILGPLLTFIVYKPKKKGLIFDLSVIAIVQFAALAYGMTIIFQERPLYIAFNIDRFTLVPAASIEAEKIKVKTLKTGLFEQPKPVYVDAPMDLDSREKRMFNVVLGKAKDIAFRAEYYQHIEQFSTHIVESKRQLSITSLLKQHPEALNQIIILEKQNKTTKEQMVFYPIEGKHQDMVIILNRFNAEVIDILNINPWTINQIRAK